MAITMTSEFPATPGQYDQVNAKLDLENSWPAGLIIHTAAQVGENMRVIDVWESEQAFNDFNEQVLMPVETEVMSVPEGAPPSPPQIQEPYNVLQPG